MIEFVLYFGASVLLAAHIVVAGMQLIPARVNSVDVCFLPFAVAAGIAWTAFLGLLTSLSPIDKQISALVLVTLTFSGLLLPIFRQRASRLRDVRGLSLYLSVWLGLTFVATAATFLPVKKPNLVDGPYPFKQWFLPVQIQAIANDLPPDNSLPAVVAEYLVRGISFKEERPVMPGQEISNRPILLSLVSVLPLAALEGEGKEGREVPKFEYVSVKWPNTLTLTSDSRFRAFLSAAILLNAAIGLAFVLLMDLFNIRSKGLVAIALLISSPYALLHTFFTWPKNLAAFFLILSLVVLARNPRGVVLSGLLTGLAYWAHPYAVAFFLVAGSMLFLMAYYHNQRWLTFAKFVLAFAVVVLPWILWTRLYLDIPSDLVAQNISSNRPLLDQAWARITNTFSLLLPAALTTYPYGTGFVRNYLITLASAVGIVFLWFLPGALVRAIEIGHGAVMLVGIASGALLILVFSSPAVPLLHGWQAIWPLIAIAVVSYLQSHRAVSSTRWPTFALYLQFALNVGFVLVWANSVVST